MVSLGLEPGSSSQSRSLLHIFGPPNVVLGYSDMHHVFKNKSKEKKIWVAHITQGKGNQFPLPRAEPQSARALCSQTDCPFQCKLGLSCDTHHVFFFQIKLKVTTSDDTTTIFGTPKPQHWKQLHNLVPSECIKKQLYIDLIHSMLTKALRFH